MSQQTPPGQLTSAVFDVNMQAQEIVELESSSVYLFLTPTDDGALILQSPAGKIGQYAFSHSSTGNRCSIRRVRGESRYPRSSEVWDPNSSGRTSQRNTGGAPRKAGRSDHSRGTPANTVGRPHLRRIREWTQHRHQEIAKRIR